MINDTNIKLENIQEKMYMVLMSKRGNDGDYDKFISGIESYKHVTIDGNYVISTSESAFDVYNFIKKPEDTFDITILEIKNLYGHKANDLAYWWKTV